jgi:biotin-(acetyl-CoA carboxylase) ligase
MSLVLAEKDFEYAFRTGFVAVCLVNVIKRHTDKKVEIKWVNDIRIDGKKVAGILVEKVGGNFIIGIGANLKTPTVEVPAEIKDIFGAIGIDTAPEVFVRELVTEIITLKLSATEVHKQYLNYCKIIGTTRAEGEVTHMQLDGSLDVRDENGEVIRVFA